MISPLLLECCRAHPDPAELRKLAAQCADWDGFVRSAAIYKATPLAFWSLNAACADAVPGPILSNLRDAFRAQTKQSLLFAAELVRRMALFHEAGLHPVPFKGPVLAWTVYEAPGLRPMRDLDLYLDEGGAAVAIQLLEARGYRRIYQVLGGPLSSSPPSVDLVSDDASRVGVDIHTRLAPEYFRGVDSARLASRLQPVVIADEEMLTLHPEDLFVYLSVHGAKHGWNSLLGICDVARIVAGFRIDWDSVLSRAHEMRIERCVLLAVRLAVDLLGADVPREVWSRVESDHAARDLAAYAYARLDRESFSTNPEWFGFQFRLLAGPADRFRLFWSYLRPNESDWRAVPLPRALFPLYIVIRPLRLAWKFGVRSKGGRHVVEK